MYSFPWTTHGRHAIHYVSMKESLLALFTTTTFHQSLLCKHELHSLHLQLLHLPLENPVYVWVCLKAIFCWINTEPDAHGYTLRTSLFIPAAACESPPSRVSAHSSVVFSSSPPADFHSQRAPSCVSAPLSVGVRSRGLISLNHLYALTPQSPPLAPPPPRSHFTSAQQ